MTWLAGQGTPPNAYGGSSMGSASTDRVILSGSHTPPVLNTWAFTEYRVGTGGGASGKLWFADGGGAVLSQIFCNGATNYAIQLKFSTTSGTWNVPIPSALTWHRHVITYDGGNVANTLAWTVDGVALTVTPTAPVGTFDVAARAICLGNRNDATPDRVWDGMIGEFGHYNRLWSAVETARYMAGHSLLGNLEGLERGFVVGPTWLDPATLVPPLVTGGRLILRPALRMLYPVWWLKLLRSVDAGAFFHPALQSVEA